MRSKQIYDNYIWRGGNSLFVSLFHYIDICNNHNGCYCIKKKMRVEGYEKYNRAVYRCSNSDNC